MLLDQQRTQIELAIRNCLRSRQQQIAVMRLLLDRAGYSTVAGELDTSLENVYVLKNKALAHLRTCRKLVDALDDLV
jgi:hypothetical protein